MKRVIIRKKSGDIILFLKIVNCDDIKIDYITSDHIRFYEDQMYYSLEKNILKLNYNDEIENVYIFTEKERKRIKKACLKLFLKEYKVLNECDYTRRKINVINKYLEEVK